MLTPSPGIFGTQINLGDHLFVLLNASFSGEKATFRENLKVARITLQ